MIMNMSVADTAHEDLGNEDTAESGLCSVLSWELSVLLDIKMPFGCLLNLFLTFLIHRRALLLVVEAVSKIAKATCRGERWLRCCRPGQHVFYIVCVTASWWTEVKAINIALHAQSNYEMHGWVAGASMIPDNAIHTCTVHSFANTIQQFKSY